MTEIIEKPWGYLVDYGDGHTDEIIKDRQAYVTDDEFSLNAETLVGSSFHVLKDGSLIWQGVVVAEPQAGHYLCQIEVLDETAQEVQRIFTLDQMIGTRDLRYIEGSAGIEESGGATKWVDPEIEWRFYDNAEKARLAWRRMVHVAEPPEPIGSKNAKQE